MLAKVIVEFMEINHIWKNIERENLGKAYRGRGEEEINICGAATYANDLAKKCKCLLYLVILVAPYSMYYCHLILSRLPDDRLVCLCPFNKA